MKFSLTITPYRLTPDSKSGPVSSSIDAESLSEAVSYAAKQLEGQPEQKTILLVVERTDV